MREKRVFQQKQQRGVGRRGRRSNKNKYFHWPRFASCYTHWCVGRLSEVGDISLFCTGYNPSTLHTLTGNHGPVRKRRKNRQLIWTINIPCSISRKISITDNGFGNSMHAIKKIWLNKGVCSCVLLYTVVMIVPDSNLDPGPPHMQRGLRGSKSHCNILYK